MYAAYRVVNSVMCDVGGRECVVVMCGSGEVYVCALDEKGITLAATIELGTKVSQSPLSMYILHFNCSYYSYRPYTNQ